MSALTCHYKIVCGPSLQVPPRNVLTMGQFTVRWMGFTEPSITDMRFSTMCKIFFLRSGYLVSPENMLRFVLLP